MSASKEEKVKHTPGPWKYHEELGAQFSMVGNSDYVVAGIPNETWTGCEDDLPIQRANARLIAAAPDLLEALETAASHVCSLLCPSVKRTGEEWTHSKECEQVRAAIAKAKGKE